MDRAAAEKQSGHALNADAPLCDRASTAVCRLQAEETYEHINAVLTATLGSPYPTQEQLLEARERLKERSLKPRGTEIHRIVQYGKGTVLLIGTQHGRIESAPFLTPLSGVWLSAASCGIKSVNSDKILNKFIFNIKNDVRAGMSIEDAAHKSMTLAAALQKSRHYDETFPARDSQRIYAADRLGQPSVAKMPFATFRDELPEKTLSTKGNDGSVKFIGLYDFESDDIFPIEIEFCDHFKNQTAKLSEVFWYLYTMGAKNVIFADNSCNTSKQPEHIINPKTKLPYYGGRDTRRNKKN